MAVPSITSGTYQLVLEADAIVGKVDGDAVATWADTSGLGNDATQATGGSQPLYKTGIINGLPVLRFDGTDDLMAVAGITNNDASRTLFIVAKQAAATSFRRAVSLGFGTGAGNGGDLMTDAGAWSYGHDQIGNSVTLGGTSTNFTIVTFRWNSTSSLDTYLSTAVANNFDPADAYQVGGTTMKIGAAGDSSSVWNGDIQTIIVVDAAVSEDDRKAIINYLGNKTGLPTFPPPDGAYARDFTEHTFGPF